MQNRTRTLAAALAVTFTASALSLTTSPAWAGPNEGCFPGTGQANTECVQLAEDGSICLTAEQARHSIQHYASLEAQIADLQRAAGVVTDQRDDLSDDLSVAVSKASGLQVKVTEQAEQISRQRARIERLRDKLRAK